MQTSALVSIIGTKKLTALLELLVHLQKDTIKKLVIASLLTDFKRTPNVKKQTLVIHKLNILLTSLSGLTTQAHHQLF